jgi:hypothetical protein
MNVSKWPQIKSKAALKAVSTGTLILCNPQKVTNNMF